MPSFCTPIYKAIVSYIFVPIAATILFFLFWGTLYFATTHIAQGTLQSILLGCGAVTLYLLAILGVIKAYKTCKIFQHKIIGWAILTVSFLVGFGIQFEMAKEFNQIQVRNAKLSEQWVHGAVNAALCEKQPCPSKSLEELVGPMRSEIEWRKLAENGDSSAQSQQCSTHGFEKDVDPEYYQKVVSWCRTDAEKGNAQSQFLLAGLYANGHANLPQSWEEAYFWYALWAVAANRRTTERDEAATHLNAQQIDSVNERIVKWKERLCASNPTERNAIIWRSAYCNVSTNK